MSENKALLLKELRLALNDLEDREHSLSFVVSKGIYDTSVSEANVKWQQDRVDALLSKLRAEGVQESAPVAEEAQKPIGKWVQVPHGNYVGIQWDKDYIATAGDELYLKPYATPQASTVAEENETEVSVVSYTLPLSDFGEGQWWIKELDALVQSPGITHDQKRAVSVVHHMLRSARSSVEDQSGKDRDKLMLAIVQAGQDAGIIRKDLEAVSGPECLMILEDIVDMAKRGASYVPISDPELLCIAAKHTHSTTYPTRCVTDTVSAMKEVLAKAGNIPVVNMKSASAIVDVPEVDKALSVFIEEDTWENAVDLVQAILDASKQTDNLKED